MTETGAIDKYPNGQLIKRSDYGEGTCPPPCRTSKGCPKGTPENPKSLSPDNEQCYQHYCECKAVGQFPDDPIVRRNAAVIEEVLWQSEQLRQAKEQNSLMQLMLVKP